MGLGRYGYCSAAGHGSVTLVIINLNEDTVATIDATLLGANSSQFFLHPHADSSETASARDQVRIMKCVAFAFLRRLLDIVQQA